MKEISTSVVFTAIAASYFFIKALICSHRKQRIGEILNLLWLLFAMIAALSYQLNKLVSTMLELLQAVQGGGA